MRDWLLGLGRLNSSQLALWCRDRWQLLGCRQQVCLWCSTLLSADTAACWPPAVVG